VSDEPWNEIDQKCPVAVAFLENLVHELDAAGIQGEAHFNATIERLRPFAVQHKTECVRCRSVGRKADTWDERSPIWGGATLGLFVGLIVGFFRENYWQTVLYAVMIGAALGVGLSILGVFVWLSERRKRN
jgi:hypothetical protein